MDFKKGADKSFRELNLALQRDFKLHGFGLQIWASNIENLAKIFSKLIFHISVLPRPFYSVINPIVVTPKVCKERCQVLVSNKNLSNVKK